MTEQASNFGQTTLASDITSGATTLTVVSAANLPTTGTFHIVATSLDSSGNPINPEIMACTSITGTTLTVTRAQESTTARAHTAGEIIANVFTAGVFATLLAGSTGNVTGPASATDTAIAVYNGTTGKIIKNSTTTIDNSGNMIVGANLSYVKEFSFSTDQNGVAAGSNQATSTPVTLDTVVVTSGTGGVSLVNATAGKQKVIINLTGANINVYPAIGGNDGINQQAINTPFAIPPFTGGFFTCASDTLWNAIITNVPPGLDYNTKSSTTSVTLLATDITGPFGFFDCTLELNGTLASAQNLTFPTVANLVASLINPTPLFQYNLRILNNSPGNFAWTPLSNTGWTFNNVTTMPSGTVADYYVTLGATLTTAVLQQISISPQGTGNSSALLRVNNLSDVANTNTSQYNLFGAGVYINTTGSLIFAGAASAGSLALYGDNSTSLDGSGNLSVASISGTGGGTLNINSSALVATGKSVTTTGTGTIVATSLKTGRTISITGDLTYTSASFDGSANVTAAGTLKNTGTAGTYGQVTTDAQGRVTAGGTNDVSHGGTGLTSATAYAVLTGGTTSTGALQSIASVGTSGQVLTSNGAGALPTFQAAGAGSGPSLGLVCAIAAGNLMP